ncbi:MAG: alpha/beta-hydrolase N-terminal domain-containing protein, partial [Alphaproteobacteria bacterium]
MLGTLLFAGSLTPSLLPRPPLIQGVLSGFAFAAGYAIGVAARWLWAYLELPFPGPRITRLVQAVAAAVCAGTAIVFLWRAAEWQNSIRVLMNLPPVEGTQPMLVGLVAAAVFAVLVGIGRLFQWTFLALSFRIKRVIPRRVSYVLGFFIAVALFWSVANGLLFSVGLRLADSSFQQIDALIESDVPRPADPSRTGSAASLISGEDLGRRGRASVASGPSAEEVGSFLGRPAAEPIRVYVGLRSAETPRERAKLALEELKRVGGFDVALGLYGDVVVWLDRGGAAGGRGRYIAAAVLDHRRAGDDAR